MIPHRPPFLFVDKVVDQTENTLIAEKFFSGDEDFFQGHFPEKKILPGVIMLEGLFQAGGHLLDCTLGVLSKVEKSKFKHFVCPPAKITYHVQLKDQLSNAAYFSGKVFYQDLVVASAHFSLCLLSQKDRDELFKA